MECRCLWAIAAFGVSCPAGAALVANPGFESRTGGVPNDWTVAGSAYSVASGKGMNGSAALQFGSESSAVCDEPVNQVVTLTPGVAYRLSAWIRTEDLKAERRGAGVGIEWWSAKGRFRDLRTEHLTGTVGEWKRVQVVTPRVPDGLRKCRVVVYAGYGKTSGKAWFDEVLVEPLAQHPISGLHCDAYRGKFSGEPLVVKASLDLPTDQMEKGLCRARLRWRKASGGFDEKEPVEFTHMTAVFSFTAGELPLGVHDLVCEVQTNGASAGTATCRVERLAKDPDFRVRFDRYGRTLVDGRPFFPLAVYERNPPESHMKRLKESGVNTVLDYIPCTREKMDEYHRNGLKVIYGLKDAFFGSAWCNKEIRSKADELPFVTERVEAFRDHPALLCWYLNDEMPIDMIPRLVERRQLFERMDPNHPTFNCLWQIEYIRDYMDATDIIGTDPYPVARLPLSLAGDWTIDTRKNTLGIRPMWQIPQAMSWTWFKSGGPNDRMPTTAELRSMCWQMIACGANGLVFYSSSGIRTRSGKDVEKNYKVLSDVVGEFAGLTDILVADPSVVRFRTGLKEDVLPVRFWDANGATYALVVNSTDAAVKARVETDTCFSSASAVFGSASVSVSGKVVETALGPWDQVLIRLGR